MEFKDFTWKDIVMIDGKVYAEEFPISGRMDDEDVWQIDDFISAVAEKYGVDTDDVETYLMDDIDFDASQLAFGAEECGCYIDGYSELEIDEDELERYTTAANSKHTVMVMLNHELKETEFCYDVCHAIDIANELLETYMANIGLTEEYKRAVDEYKENGAKGQFTICCPAAFSCQVAWCIANGDKYEIVIMMNEDDDNDNFDEE